MVPVWVRVHVLYVHLGCILQTVSAKMMDYYVSQPDAGNRVTNVTVGKTFCFDKL